MLIHNLQAFIQDFINGGGTIVTTAKLNGVWEWPKIYSNDHSIFKILEMIINSSIP